MALQIITANRLGDGFVVYLTALGALSQRITDAVVFLDAAQSEQRLTALGAANGVIDPYAIEVTTGDNAIVPVRLRERIRAFGPTMETGRAVLPLTVAAA